MLSFYVEIKKPELRPVNCIAMQLTHINSGFACRTVTIPFHICHCHEDLLKKGIKKPKLKPIQ